MNGSHVLLFWCKLQDRIATSSGVAELKSSCKGISELILMRNVATFMGPAPSLVHCTDANANKGILLRQGAGPVKHLDIRQLWVQEAIQDYQIQVVKIPRENNPSDFLCSPSRESELETRVAEFSCHWPDMNLHFLPRVPPKGESVVVLGRKKRIVGATQRLTSQTSK